MATKCYICVKQEQEHIYDIVFCRYNGAPQYLGSILKEHYNTLEKATALVSFNTLCTIEEKVEECREDEYFPSDITPIKTASYDQILRLMDDGGVHFFYMYEDDDWVCHASMRRIDTIQI